MDRLDQWTTVKQHPFQDTSSQESLGSQFKLSLLASVGLLTSEIRGLDGVRTCSLKSTISSGVSVSDLAMTGMMFTLS